MGVAAKPAGPRRLQPVADRFFFWVRASMLETRRVANWWADRMVATNRPLQEKLALFWHGHFASGEEKVRDYRKMLARSCCSRSTPPEISGPCFPPSRATRRCWSISTPGRT